MSKKNNYHISNLYIDTDDYNLISTSLMKPLYKHKLRIRSYDGFNNLDQIVFIEIKKKFRGLVNKRRSSIKLRDAYNLIHHHQLPKEEAYMNFQVLREIKQIIKYQKFRVKSQIDYTRIAFFDHGEHDLRISFDEGIAALTKKIIYVMVIV